MTTRKQRPAKYQVTRTGPGSFGGVKFSSRSEAIAYANHELKMGRSITIIVL